MTTMPYQEAPSALAGPDLRAACAEAIHLVTPEGEILKAGRAVLHIFRLLGWPRVAALGEIPPFIWAIELGYAFVARNRRFFALFLFRSE